jgi:hypothetical protein
MYDGYTWDGLILLKSWFGQPVNSENYVILCQNRGSDN